MTTPTYNGWLVSPSLTKRAVAVFGHLLFLAIAVAFVGCVLSVAVLALSAIVVGVGA